mgnify:CR=1 FL=1
MVLRYAHNEKNIKASQHYQDIKHDIHRHLVQCIEDDNAPINEWLPEQLSNYVYSHVSDYANTQQLIVTSQILDEMTEEIVHELVGYGPLQPLLNDDSINDIMVNGAEKVFCEKNGKIDQSSIRFINDEHILRIVRRMIAPVGRRLDESSPMVDARLPDGSRVNAIIPPLALDGPCVSIRKFRQDMLLETDLLSYGTLSQDMFEFLSQAVKTRCNILISGGTGSGKTTLLNILTRFIPPGQRLVTIEDAAELQLGHKHVVRLETRPPNIEGQGEITSRDLVKNSLRMRPDRIIVGEVRGEEVLDLLQSMNTGHDGSMSTVHANNTRDALVRLEMLASLAKFQGGREIVRNMISSALDVLVHISRFPDGKRRITAISEITGYQDGQFMSNELFKFDTHQERYIRVVPRPASEKLRHSSFQQTGYNVDWEKKFV